MDVARWWIRKRRNRKDCIIREMKEETNLDVEVNGILFDEPGNGKDVWRNSILQ